MRSCTEHIPRRPPNWENAQPCFLIIAHSHQSKHALQRVADPDPSVSPISIISTHLTCTVFMSSGRELTPGTPNDCDGEDETSYAAGR